MIRFDRVVRVLLHDVQGRGDQFVEDPRVDGRAVGRDFDWDRAGMQRSSEEAPGGGQITSRR